MKEVKGDRGVTLGAALEKRAKAEGKSLEAIQQEMLEGFKKEILTKATSNSQPALRLYHEDGKPRGIFMVGEEGQGLLSFPDEDYEPGILLYHGESGASLKLADKKGLEIDLSVHPVADLSSAMLRFYDKQRSELLPFASFGRDLSEGVSLEIRPKRDGSLHPRILLGSLFGDDVGLHVYNGEKSKIDLGLDSGDEKPRLQFYEGGKLRAVLGSTELETPSTAASVSRGRFMPFSCNRIWRQRCVGRHVVSAVFSAEHPLQR